MTRKQHKPDSFKIMYVEKYQWTKETVKDGFGIYYKFTDQDDYVLQSFYPLTRREGQSEEAEPDFIHWGIIDEMKRLSFLGFRFVR